MASCFLKPFKGEESMGKSSGEAVAKQWRSSFSPFLKSIETIMRTYNMGDQGFIHDLLDIFGAGGRARPEGMRARGGEGSEGVQGTSNPTPGSSPLPVVLLLNLGATLPTQ